MNQQGGTPTIRKAISADAEAIIAILQGIAAERIYTAVTRPWSADEQRRHLESFSPREVIHVAEPARQGIAGYQVLELWAPTLESMSHVGQIGTFLAPQCRRHGIGEALFRATLDFARKHEYGKFVIQVRSANTSAQAFYRRLGFRECGLLTRQVRIDGAEEDEVMMEFFL